MSDSITEFDLHVKIMRDGRVTFAEAETKAFKSFPMVAPDRAMDLSARPDRIETSHLDTVAMAHALRSPVDAPNRTIGDMLAVGRLLRDLGKGLEHDANILVEAANEVRKDLEKKLARLKRVEQERGVSIASKDFPTIPFRRGEATFVIVKLDGEKDAAKLKKIVSEV